MFNPNIGIVFDSLEIYTNKSSVLQVLPTQPWLLSCFSFQDSTEVGFRL